MDQTDGLVHLHLNNRGEWDRMIHGYSLTGGGLIGGVLVKDPGAENRYRRYVEEHVDAAYRSSWRR